MDRGILDQQLQALGQAGMWWEKRELRDLPAILHPSEQILAIAYGKVARMRWLRRSWLMVVTNERLLCIKSSRRSWRQFEIAVDHITRLRMRVGPFRGRVIIHAGNDRLRLLTERASAYMLLNALRDVAINTEETVPGTTPVRVVRRVFDHMLALPGVAFNPGSPRPSPSEALLPPADDYVQNLESEVEQLRQQVDFLEQLLRERQSQ